MIRTIVTLAFLTISMPLVAMGQQPSQDLSLEQRSDVMKELRRVGNYRVCVAGCRIVRVLGTFDNLNQAIGEAEKNDESGRRWIVAGSELKPGATEDLSESTPGYLIQRTLRCGTLYVASKCDDARQALAAPVKKAEGILVIHVDHERSKGALVKAE